MTGRLSKPAPTRIDVVAHSAALRQNIGGTVTVGHIHWGLEWAWKLASNGYTGRARPTKVRCDWWPV